MQLEKKILYFSIVACFCIESNAAIDYDNRILTVEKFRLMTSTEPEKDKDDFFGNHIRLDIITSEKWSWEIVAEVFSAVESLNIDLNPYRKSDGIVIIKAEVVFDNDTFVKIQIGDMIFFLKKISQNKWDKADNNEKILFNHAKTTDEEKNPCIQVEFYDKLSMDSIKMINEFSQNSRLSAIDLPLMIAQSRKAVSLIRMKPVKGDGFSYVKICYNWRLSDQYNDALYMVKFDEMGGWQLGNQRIVYYDLEAAFAPADK